MATFRVGVGSFNIQDGAVGFGTDTDGLGNLKVKGVTKTTDIKVSGASTLTRYSGFAADNIDQLENITLTSEVGTIGDIVVGVGTSVIISSGSTVTVGTVESVSIGTHFSPPKGGIEERGDDFVEGMMRFNIDLNTMEFYNGNEWRQFTYIADIQNSPSSRGRGIIGGGYDTAQPANSPSIEFVNIASRGNAVDFGTVNVLTYGQAGSASEIRGIISGGSGYNDQIEYITIASEGNGIDFGNMSASKSSHTAACNSSTRSIFSGGYISPGVSSNILDYVEIMTLGNALDFGDLVEPRYGLTSFSSPVRGVCAGGRNYPAGDSPLGTRMIDIFTIASKGNATRFGDLYAKHSYMSSTGNSIRGVIGAGTNDPSSVLSFITIASEGNSIFFGNLNNSGGGFSQGNCSSSTRGLFAAGGNPAKVNTIDEISIQSAGNATDFGDLSVKRGYCFGLSDSNGGLGGY